MNTKIIFAVCMLLVGLSLVSAVSIKDVSSSPSEVAPGEVVSVTIKIENIFEDDIYNLFEQELYKFQKKLKAKKLI